MPQRIWHPIIICVELPIRVTCTNWKHGKRDSISFSPFISSFPYMTISLCGSDNDDDDVYLWRFNRCESSRKKSESCQGELWEVRWPRHSFVYQLVPNDGRKLNNILVGLIQKIMSKFFIVPNVKFLTFNTYELSYKYTHL